MKILMISAIDVSDTSGSVDHFTGVANALSAGGAEVTVVACCKDMSKVRLSSTIKSNFINCSNLSVFETLFRVSKKAIETEKLINFDILYLRVFPLDYVFLVWKLKASKAILVCELNTKIGPEYRSKNKRMRSAVYEFFEGRTLSVATAWLPVTSEIYDYAVKISGVKKPFLIARNGADFSSFHTIDIETSRSEVRQALEILDTAVGPIEREISLKNEKAAAELKAKQEAEAKAAAELKAKQEAEARAAASKKSTITCIKGKLTKKVTGSNPKCPSSYKFKK